MVRKIYLVGLLVDDRLNEVVVRNYIHRAIKHFHESKDDQGSFQGAARPERIAVIDVDNSANRTLQEMTDFFTVMDRMEGKK